MIEYEWAIEDVNTETGDIEDLDFAESLDEFYTDDLDDAIKGHEVEPGIRLRLVLVRDNRSRTGNLLDRQWAYVIDGNLESEFRGSGDESGAKVPAKFKRELTSHVR